MSMVSVDCRILTCDGCEAEYENADGFIQHYRPGDTAGTWEDEWYLGEKDYCDICRVKVEHEHIWDGGQCDVCREDEPEEDEE